MDLLAAGGAGLLIFDVGFLCGAWWGYALQRSERTFDRELEGEEGGFVGGTGGDQLPLSEGEIEPPP